MSKINSSKSSHTFRIRWGKSTVSWVETILWEWSEILRLCCHCPELISSQAHTPACTLQTKSRSQSWIKLIINRSGWNKTALQSLQQGSNRISRSHVTCPYFLPTYQKLPSYHKGCQSSLQSWRGISRKKLARIADIACRRVRILITTSHIHWAIWSKWTHT